MASTVMMRATPLSLNRTVTTQRGAAALRPAPLRPSSRLSSHVVASYGRRGSSAYKEAEVEAEDVGNELSEKAQEYVEIVKQKWEETEEKPAVVAISIASFIAIWAASGVVDAVDKLPLVGGLLEVIGLGVSGWFAYRYLFNAADREELKDNIDNFFKKVGAE